MRVVSLIFGLIGLLVVGCGSDLRCRDAEEIPLPGANYFPEGIAGDAEGRLYVGSVATGRIVRVEPCASDQAHTVVPEGELRNVIGLHVDDQLWVCNSDFTGDHLPEIVAIDRESGAIVARHSFPEGSGVCNDLTTDETHVYATDSFAHRVVRVSIGAEPDAPAEVWLSDPRFGEGVAAGEFGLNGITWDGAQSLYLANFRRGEIYRVDVASRSVDVVRTGLGAPDGIEWLGAGRLLVVEGALARLSELDLRAGEIEVLREGLDFPSTSAVVEGGAWVVQGQLDHLLDPSAGPPSPPFVLTFVRRP